MAIITDDYVSFETAKLLKEKGFNEECSRWYVANEPQEGTIEKGFGENQFYINAPTLQMAMKWLRELHHLYIQIMLDSYACGGHTGYYVVIQNTHSDFEMMLQDAVDNVFYNTYERACEQQ